MLENVDPIVWIVVAVVVALVVIALVISGIKKRKRTEHLRQRFGPEYDRAITRAGSRSKGEAELLERESRRDGMSLRPLSSERRRELMGRWEEIQVAFVDGPESAVRAAEVLLDDAARERGYPDADPDQRLRDLAVDHSDEVERYRRAMPDQGDRKGKHARQDDADSLRRRLLAARELFEAIIGPDTQRARAGDHTGRAAEAPSDRVAEAPSDRVAEAPSGRAADDDRRDVPAARPAAGDDRSDGAVGGDRDTVGGSRPASTSERDDAARLRDGSGTDRSDADRHDDRGPVAGVVTDRHDAGAVRDGASEDRPIADRAASGDADHDRGGLDDRGDASDAEPGRDRHADTDTDEPLAGTPARSEERTVSPPPPLDPDEDPGPLPPEPR